MGTEICIGGERIVYKLFRINSYFLEELAGPARSMNHSKSVNVTKSDRSVDPHKISYRMVSEEFSSR